ncbi:uncharacterized protein N7483_001133 [Penicillium malachiteum]|uniref:uncharacterized protein n=1 Tax=Penicillium malachiteum TaxID=1324776 RepID=UPI002546FD9E|nr:uncharacterized protein N7483_001133 [Penicillium malachiteum]KAJ5736008.1 hypothetical protein N7483_001133 [Penicillium malachiteum]
MSAASQDRDWSILPKDEPDDQDDQATNLPLSFNLDITSVHYFLKNPGDFDIWLRNITWYLKTLGLDKLLDIKVPRPRRESPESSRWLDFSRKVSKWLAHNISDDLLKKILAHGKRTELADELIAEAKAEFETAAIYADISCVQKFMWIIPDTYATTKEFVLQFMEMLLDIWATQPVRIHPYFALCQLLVKLHIFDNKSIFAPIIADLNKKADDYHLQSDFSIVDFQDTCHNIVERLETAQAVLRLQNRKYWPPPGANHHEHAKMLRETLPQYTEDKKCAYCGGLFHLASKCYWLNPDARPPNWQPKGGIWMYEPEKFDAQTLDSPTPAAQTLGGSTGDSSSVDDSSSSGLTLGGITIGSPSVGRPVVGDKTAVKQRQLSINEEEKAPAADENRQDAPKFGSIEARIFGKRSTEPTGPAEPLIKLSDNGKVKPWVIVDEDAPHACG